MTPNDYTYPEGKRSGFTLIPYVLLLVAGVLLGYTLPPVSKPKEKPRVATTEETLKLLEAMPDPELLGRYQFFTMGNSRVPLRGDTITGKVTMALPDNMTASP